jgi:hypothetical protein
MIGLLRYLFGPGRHHEHKDPHVIVGAVRIPRSATWSSGTPKPPSPCI